MNPRELKMTTGGQVFRRTKDAAELVCEVQVEFTWRAYDPFAVRIDFTHEDGIPVDWYVGLDLFIEASADKANAWHGQGEIAVQFTGNAVYLSVGTGPDGALVKMAAADVAPWLGRAAVAQVTHAADTAQQIHDELSALLRTEA